MKVVNTKKLTMKIKSINSKKNTEDKFNILYNEIKLMKKERSKIEYNKEIEEMKNKINELNINMNILK